MSEIAAGTLVINPRMPTWGPGKVANVRNTTAFVFFRDVSDRQAKRFKTDQLQVADVQSDDILDNLPPYAEKNGEYYLPSDRITLEVAVSKFLEVYPGGFYDPAYLSTRGGGERGYKWEAHEIYQELLGQGKGEALLSTSSIDDLVTYASRVGGRVNLLAIQEASAFREGLNNRKAAAQFFETLFALIRSGPARGEFEVYAAAVSALPAIGATHTNKWTIATLLPALAMPDAFIFIKPTITQTAATRLGFDIRYDARPNWATYDAVLRMAALYKDKLASLKPRDFIDIQSFFWVTGENYDITVQRRKASGRDAR